MKNNDIKYKTIAIDPITHSMISKMASENNKTSKEFVAAMAKYFAKYGVDIDSSPANLAKEMKSLDKRFIGFIRKQEELFHIPLASQMEMQKNQLLGLKQIVLKLAEQQTLEIKKLSQNLEKTKEDQDSMTLSKLSFQSLNTIAGIMITLNKKFNIIPPKEKYSYQDCVIIGNKLIERLK